MRQVEIERLRHLLTYDAETGQCRWRVGRPGASKGGLAGCLRPDGYHAICVDRVQIVAHRIIWAMVYGEWPQTEVDHKNLNRGDNRLENLRLASSSQNKTNACARRTNKIGLKGVSIHGTTGRWVAQIQKDNKTHYLGLFDDAEEAHAAYCEAARRLHGEFARAA